MKIDRLSLQILEELQLNARTPLTEISKRVGLSSPTVAERIQKMEDADIINGYTANLNMESLGYALGVYISIKIRFGQVKNFEEYIETVPEIYECHKLTGHDCMMMKGVVRNPKHLEALNAKLSMYGELTTSLILSSIIKNRVYNKEF
ncbi:MAG: Lrp/AsnC family transcriptional regulator [Flavobacteriaceae bacterium]|nr:Lrp/AsnC family transcriptional regulator [Flavobacteriaceae bacterium]